MKTMQFQNPLHEIVGANSSHRSYIIFGGVPNEDGHHQREAIELTIYDKGEVVFDNLTGDQLDDLTALVGRADDDDSPFYGIVQHAGGKVYLFVTSSVYMQGFETVGYIAGYIDQLLNIPRHSLVGDYLKEWRAWVILTPTPEEDNAVNEPLPEIPEIPEIECTK